MYKQCKTTDKTTYIKQCKRTYVRIYIIVKLIGDIMEKYMLTFLTGYQKDTKEILFYYCLIGC